MYLYWESVVVFELKSGNKGNSLQFFRHIKKKAISFILCNAVFLYKCLNLQNIFFSISDISHCTRSLRICISDACGMC